MSIRWRLAGFYTLTILVIAGLLVGALFAVRAVGLVSELEEKARARAFEAARIVERDGALSAEDGERFGADHATIIGRDGQGQVLVRAGAELPGSSAEALTVWREALATGAPAEGQQANEEIYVYAVPVAPPGSPLRVVEAALPYTNVGEGFIIFAPLVLAAVVIGVAIALGSSYILTWTAFAPVNAIVRSAREISDRDLSRRLPVRSRRDELGRLAMTFNDLLARLEVAFRDREEALSRQRRFVSDAGHELRTPLASILGYARMLRAWGLKDEAVAREGIAAMEQEAERMAGLVEEMLDLARGDEDLPLALASHDLGTVAQAAVQAACPAAEGKVELHYRPPRLPVLATFDEARIRQAAGILIDNAVKYTPPGGTVTVSVDEVEGRAELEVLDTGIGIAPQHLPHIFDRFYRVDEARGAGGSGLGLAIARQIAEAHGGEVTVISLPGKGSAFTLAIPAEADGGWPSRGG